MRAVIVFLIATLCVVNAANMRATIKSFDAEIERSPRFAFHAYETQPMAKGDDGESDVDDDGEQVPLVLR